MTYSTEQQTQIIKMKSEGKSSRKIANELGLSKSGVNEFYNRTVLDNDFSLGDWYDQFSPARNKLEGISPLINYVTTFGEDCFGQEQSKVRIVNHVDDCRKADKGLEQLLFASTEAKTWKDMQNWYKENVLEKDPTIKGRSFDYIIEDDLEYEAAQKEDNSVILFISDMHAPYNHKNLIPFLKSLKEKYKPTRVICLGDEVDSHSMSFHPSDADLMSAGDELIAARKVLKQVEELFPVMDIIDSNHGSMIWRKAKMNGIPRAYIKSYQDVLQVGKGWKWHRDLTVTLPNGHKVYVHHGKTSDAMKVSQTMGMSHVCGHFHESFRVQYWANPNDLYFAINSGCLVDDDSYAYAYNNTNLKRPLIGTSLIVNGIPVLEAMPL